MQKICIRNNGPVKYFEMEIEKFNLLIGEQATGKSTIAKSVYFFKTIKTKIIDYLTQIYDTNSYHNTDQENIWFDRAIKSELKNIFIQLFGYNWDLNSEFYMKYDYAEDLSIQVQLKKGDRNRQYISVTYSRELLGSIKKLQKEIQNIYHDKEKIIQASLVLTNEERKRNHEMNIRKVNSIFLDSKETYYIPAGRSLLTVMSNNRAVMNNAKGLDLITEMFMVLIDNVRNSFRDGVKKAHLFYPVEKRPFDIQKITYFIVNMEKGEYFYSGGKEFISFFTNIQESGVFITTHSPYMLTVANNLYYAGVLSQEGQSKEVSKAVNKNYSTKKGELSAYKLLNIPVESGKKNYIDLLDEEKREIGSSLIDDVSSQINELYTALYDIELDKEQE